MTTSFKKKLFLLVFCLASITQGMYSTYFVSILTTIERIYQIQSKTAGAILSATEIGQILGSLFIAYYGGRGNKPKWIAFCMTLSALAALISISPHLILLTTNDTTLIGNQETPLGRPIESPSYLAKSSITQPPYLTSDLSTPVSEPPKSTFAPEEQKMLARVELPSIEQLCRIENYTGLAPDVSVPTMHDGSQLAAKGIQTLSSSSSTSSSIDTDQHKQLPFPVSVVIAIFFTCLLAIGFGSTAITTLGIPFIDDIISREESPLYLGVTIGLRIFGPALGFILGSFCISFKASSSFFKSQLSNGTDHPDELLGAWWLGLIVISLPLLLLALPMYFLSRVISSGDSEGDDYEDITYQAAEDHDIGGSHEFSTHIMGLAGELEITSGRTCFSCEIDSSSREVLQLCQGPTSSTTGAYVSRKNYQHNIAFEQPILSGDGLVLVKTKSDFPRSSEEINAEAYVDDAQHVPVDNKEAQWQAKTNVCLVVNHYGVLESTRFVQDESQDNSLLHCRQRLQQQQQNQSCVPEISARSSAASSMSVSFATDEQKSKRRPGAQLQPFQQQSQSAQDKPTITDLSSSLSRLLKNRLLILRMLSGVLHILPIAGFYTFLPKYLIEQFRITSSKASIISGLAGILFVGFGAFIGGTIIRVFNVNSKLMTRWIATSALLYTIGMIILMNLSCEQNQMVHFGSSEYVSTDCSLSCKCTETNFNPVCANGTTYVSPCLAGCKSYTIFDGKVIYDECGCTKLALDGLSFNGTDPQTLKASTRSSLSSHVNLNVATHGQCSTKCDNIFWYVILFSIFTLIHSSCEVGSMMFNLRCVKSGERTLALGLITFTSSLFGTIPCSIIYGSIADLTCVHWDELKSPSTGDGMMVDQTQHGACRAYDNDSFRYYLHGLTALVMSFAFIVDWIISKRASEVDFYCEQDDSKLDIRVGLKKSTETIQ